MVQEEVVEVVVVGEAVEVVKVAAPAGGACIRLMITTNGCDLPSAANGSALPSLFWSAAAVAASNHDLDLVIDMGCVDPWTSFGEWWVAGPRLRSAKGRPACTRT